jgi:hypothetical protein
VSDPTRFEIERIGGLGGFGLPQSRVRSHGEVTSADLTQIDRDTLESLFIAPPMEKPGTADAFRYRLTRHTDAGPQVIEVPEHAVPSAIKARVKDELI